MQISLLDLDEIYKYSTSDGTNNNNIGGIFSCDSEILRDRILEKISLLIVAYFCVSTEYRFLVSLKSNNGEGKPDILTK